MWRFVVIIVSCLILLPLVSLAKEDTLVFDVTLPKNTIVKSTDHVQLMYTIRLDALNGKKEAIIDLPTGVILQKKSEQSFEDDYGNRGSVFFEDDTNQLHFVIEDAAYFYKNKTMTLTLPVLMDDVKVGGRSLVVHTANGDKTLSYTIEKMKSVGELNVKNTVEGAFIHWTVEAYTKKNTYRSARFVSTLGDELQLDGQVHVKYQSVKTEMIYDKFFNVRPNAANEIKLNLGDLDEQKMTIMFKTKVNSPTSFYTNDVALTSTNQPILEKQGVAKVAESAIDTTLKVTQPTETETTIDSNYGKMMNEDIIVWNDGETELIELPQTGEHTPIFIGIWLLAISILLLYKRRKIII